MFQRQLDFLFENWVGGDAEGGGEETKQLRSKYTSFLDPLTNKDKLILLRIHTKHFT